VQIMEWDSSKQWIQWYKNKTYDSWQHFKITIHNGFLKLQVCCDRPEQWKKFTNGFIECIITCDIKPTNCVYYDIWM
jgi:hypothetical protein